FDMVSAFAGRQTYRSFAAVGKLVGSAAVTLTEHFSVGATLGLAVNHTELETPFYFQTGVLSGVPYLADLHATGYAPTWTVGVSYNAAGGTTIGAVYTDDIHFAIKGKANTTVFVPAPQAASFNAKVNVTLPRSAGVGVRHQIGRAHVVS